MIVTMGGTLDSYKQLKDRGMKITFETGELNAEQVLGIHELYNKAVHISIGLNPVRFEDIQEKLPTAVEQVPNKKSASQRLRSVLYRLWEQGGEAGEFNDYYETMMDKIIDFYKDKLD